MANLKLQTIAIGNMYKTIQLLNKRFKPCAKLRLFIVRTLQITVKDQTVKTNEVVTVNGTVGLIKCAFNFDEYWGNFPAKRALFKNNNQTGQFGADIINDTCLVPWEVLAVKGEIYMAVEGKNTIPQTERSEKAVIIRQTKTLTRADNTIVPTPDQYAQFIADVKAWCEEQHFATTEEMQAYVQQIVPDGVAAYMEEHHDEFIGPEGPAGADGQDGYSPVRGTDYWTEQDKAEIISDTEEAVEPYVDGKISPIEAKIPAQATSTNKLADKEFVNSSISTNTATFRGTFTSTSEFPTTGVDDNDYVFLKVMSTEEPTQVERYDRYKWNGTQFAFEYSLNNSSFTAEQWGAINSGITTSLVDDIGGIKEAIQELQTGKVDKETGKGLSANDYTTAEKDKLASLENYDDIDVVKYTEQTKTDSEKAQARENINAAAPDGYYGDSGGVYQYATNFLGKNTPSQAKDLVFRPTAANFSGSDWVGDSIGGQTATIEKIKGKTLVWNQRIGATTASAGGSSAGITPTMNGATGEFTLTGTSTGNFDAVIVAANSVLTIGHKYLYSLPKVTGITWADSYNAQYSKTESFIFTAINTFMNIRARGLSGVTLNVIGKVAVFDLTQMFGAGNEPSTVEEFKAQFPLDYYEYNTGELISFNGTGLKTVGFNQMDSLGKVKVIKGLQYEVVGTKTGLAYSDGTEITLSNNLFTADRDDIVTVSGFSSNTCVHLTWSGYRNGEYEPYWDNALSLPIADYFPEGMCSAGTACDELVKDKAIKRIAKVDMGTLNWFRVTEGKFYCRNSDVKNNGYHTNLLCSRYITAYSQDKFVDKTISGISEYWADNIIIRDSSFSSASELKASLSGVYLYYELVTPVETPISPELNLTYKVDDFGTEMLLPENISDELLTTPMDADIIYQIDYEANIRNNDQLNITKESMDNFISAFNSSGLGTIVQTWDATNKKYTYTVTPPVEPQEA